MYIVAAVGSVPHQTGVHKSSVTYQCVITATSSFINHSWLISAAIRALVCIDGLVYVTLEVLVSQFYIGDFDTGVITNSRILKFYFY